MQRVIAVIGPSGSGKSSLVRELDRRGVVRVHPTWTTRPRRADESEGSVEHRFVTEDVFDRACARGCFVATATPFGLPWRYGLPPIPPAVDDRIDLVMLRAPVVERLRPTLGLSLVIQVEDDRARVARRLLARGSGVEDVVARLVDNRDELLLGRAVADVTIVNDGTIGELADETWDTVQAGVHDLALAPGGGRQQ